MPNGDWDSISREVVSLFTSLTDQPPVYIICLDWNLICTEFTDEDGWTKWTNDGTNLSRPMEEKSASFVIFSKAGIHQMFYHLDKEPEVKHLLTAKELLKFKIIKVRHDKIDLQIEREKDFILGKMNFIDSHKLRFNSEQWDYLSLRRQIIIGKKLVLKFLEAQKAKQVRRIRVPRAMAAKAKPAHVRSRPEIQTQTQAKVRSGAHKQPRKPMEILVDDYEDSMESAKKDISALKNRENRKLANSALEKMDNAKNVIKRCDRDVRKRNERIRKLRQEKLRLKKKPMRKLEKRSRLEELERKIEMIDRMNEKELSIKTQKVTEFCGLREAILTIRTNEEKLTPQDVNLLIDKAYLSEMQDEDIDKAIKKLKHYKNE
ncbi:hypothetical protein [[Eubacterium] cellulosolvens]